MTVLIGLLALLYVLLAACFILLIALVIGYFLSDALNAIKPKWAKLIVPIKE